MLSRKAIAQASLGNFARASLGNFAPLSSTIAQNTDPAAKTPHGRLRMAFTMQVNNGCEAEYTREHCKCSYRFTHASAILLTISGNVSRSDLARAGELLEVTWSGKLQYDTVIQS